MDDTPLISVEIDYERVHQLVAQNIQEHLKSIDNKPVFYTLRDLGIITGMSRGFIESTFFHDPRFEQIRRKVGRKWLFPAKETRKFLEIWIQEQPNS